MAKTQQSVVSFTSGVLTPRISARTDSPKFVSALQRGENWIITPQGGVVLRQGFEHIEETNQNRMFQFHRGGNFSDIIVEVLPTSTYGNGDIHFHTDDDLANPIASLIDVHSFTSTDLLEMYFTNQEHLAVLCNQNHPPLYLELKNDGTFTASELPSNVIPEFDYRDEDSPASSITNSADYETDWIDGEVGTTGNKWENGKRYEARYDGVTAQGDKEYQVTSANHQNRLLNLLERIPVLTSNGTTVAVNIIGTPDSTTRYDVVINGPNSGKLLEIFPRNTSATREVSITNSLEDLPVLEPAWSFPTYVFHLGNYFRAIATHTSETAVNEPPNASFWFDEGITKPDTFDYQYPTGNAWLTGINYAKGDRGFPSVCVFHEQRLILAANPSRSTGLWGSRIGEYRDFVAGVNAADPFVFTLDTADTPTIKWMTSQLDLIVGTSAGDWAISAEVTLGPGDIAAEKQNYARSHHSIPVSIETNIFYIEQGLTKIRMTQYERQKLGFVSSDISIIAEQLLHAGVKRIVILRTPEVLMVGLRQDGVLIALTYGEEIGAWTELKSQGFVHDISAYYSVKTNQDELWVTIAYNFAEEGPNQFYLEKMPYPSRTMVPRLTAQDESLTDQGVVLLDSWVTGQVGSNNIITGLDHLDGNEVAALVEDAWTGTYTVTNGQITLDDTNILNSEDYSGTFAVGLLYTGDLKTFEIADGNPRGTGMGTSRKWGRLFTRLLDSALPIINGTLPPDRTPETEMNIAEIIRLGLQDVAVRNLGWGDGSITIIQDRPYPTHVVGLFGEFQLHND